MPQKILPSAHLLELFMPYRGDESRMIKVVQKAVELDYYKGVELGIFFNPINRRTIRNILEENQLHGTTFLTPYIKDYQLNLSDLNTERRKEAVAFVKFLANYAADAGYTTLGVPGGDDPGYLKRELAKSFLAESLIEIAEHCKKLGVNLTIEPLDRYAYKKQLIGPMEETVLWFKSIYEVCPNIYIHWDSAHEALGGIDLMRSIELASPYLAQFHLCNAILDPKHPCFGDLHMDVGEAPDYETEGFLTTEVGGKILQKVSSLPKPNGIKNVFVSVEVLGHPGDDLWRKERSTRSFLRKCFELAEE